MVYRCKNCGNKISFAYGKQTSYCKNCGKELTLSKKDVIDSSTFRTRIAQLKAMHELMCNANDEGVYMSWILEMPDCPNEGDFESIALEDDMYNECFDLFVKLVQDDGNRW